MQRQFLLLFAVLGQFLVEQAHFEHIVDALVHFEQVEGLADEVARAGLEGGDLEGRLGGQGQHGQVAALFDFLEALHDLETVEFGHLQVEQYQVVAMFAVQGAHLGRQHGGAHIAVAGVVQDFKHQFDIVGAIINDQYFCVEDIFLAGHRDLGSGSWERGYM